jgi:hypothetical protein
MDEIEILTAQNIISWYDIMIVFWYFCLVGPLTKFCMSLELLASPFSLYVHFYLSNSHHILNHYGNILGPCE